MVAYLGTGLLGANFVRAMIGKGEQVQVWNRTFSKAKALEQYGAKVFAEVVDAVRGASIVHMTLKDDATVDEVLAKAAVGLGPGTAIIDHTTTSAAGAIRRAKEWKAKGFIYLHAPVFMGPPNALDSTGIMLVSGDQAVVAKYEPVLAKMTGKLLNFGESEGKAAAIKLLGNLFLVTFTGGIVDMMSLAKAEDVSIADLLSLFDTWNPGALLPARLKRMSSGDYSSPSWELEMARKDTRLMMEAAGEKGRELVVIPAVAAEMDKWIGKGHGHDDWTVIAKDAIP